MKIKNWYEMGYFLQIYITIIQKQSVLQTIIIKYICLIKLIANYSVHFVTFYWGIFVTLPYTLADFGYSGFDSWPINISCN